MPESTAYESVPAHREESASAPEAMNLAGKRVVIVEDEGMTQMQMQRILTHAGLIVVGTARTGEDGVQVVLRERPDLVLMDIKMRGSINGLEATRCILVQQSVCVLMLSAYAEHQEEAEKIGACGYILKPINGATLLPRIQAAWETWTRRQTQ